MIYLKTIKKFRLHLLTALTLLLVVTVTTSCTNDTDGPVNAKPQYKYLFGGEKVSADLFFEVSADGGSVSFPPKDQSNVESLYIPRFAIDRSLQWIEESGYEKYTPYNDRCELINHSVDEETWREATFYYFVDGYAGKTHTQYPWEQDIKLFMDRTNFHYGSMEWASFEFHKGECIVTLPPNNSDQVRYISLIYDNVSIVENRQASYGAVEVKQPAQ